MLPGNMPLHFFQKCLPGDVQQDHEKEEMTMTTRRRAKQPRISHEEMVRQARANDLPYDDQMFRSISWNRSGKNRTRQGMAA